MLVRNVEKKENNTATFQVEVDPAEFDKAIDKAYNNVKGSINIPGFRKGKAPRAVVEGMYGPDAFYQDAIEVAAPDAFGYGIDNSGLKMIGRPSMTDVEITDDKALVMTFKVDLFPEITLGQYKGLSAQKGEAVVTDEMVEAEINADLKRNSRFVDVDREAQEGDTANIDFDGYLDGEQFEGGYGEGYRLEIGSKTFVPGFEDQIIGMKVGETKDINITFPENYTEELAGKDVVFKVKLNSLCVAELPEFDDEFVQDISEFETVDEFKADLRKEMEKRAVENVESAFRSDIMMQACENMTVDIPEVLINAKVEELVHTYANNFGVTDPKLTTEDIIKMMGLDDESLNTTIRPVAVNQVKQELLLEAVIEAEGIDISGVAFDEYVKTTAESVNATPESILNYFGEDFIKNEYKREQATKIIMDSAIVAPKEEAAE